MTDSLKRWLAGVAGTVVAALLVTVVVGLFSLRDRVMALEAQQGLPARMLQLERDVVELKSDMRHATTDTDKLEKRLDRFGRQGMPHGAPVAKDADDLGD